MDSRIGFQMETPEVKGSGNAHSKYALFLIEQLIVILVFALCAAICVSIFADSYIMAGSSNDMNCALTASESAAETFKALGQDADRLAQLLQGVNDGGTVRVYYDTGWRLTNDRENAVYVMTMIFEDGPFDLSLCNISVDKTAGENILSITAARRP